MFFIQQANTHDCGFTALKILLANIHHDENYLFIKSPFKDDNVSFYSLVKEGERYQTELQAVKAVDKNKLRNNKEFPFIARVKVASSFHALYVYKISKRYVFYIDPALGKEKLPINEFISIWTGEFIMVKSFQKLKCPIAKEKYLKVTESLLMLMISFFSTVSSVLAIYFINKDAYIYLPIIFFSVALVLEMLLKKFSLLIMKKIDNRVNNDVKEIENKDYYNFYINYEHYKKYLLVNNLSLFTSIFIFLLISLVFIINDRFNVIYILVSLVLAITYSFFIKPYIYKDEKDILLNEEKIKTSSNYLEAYHFMDIARSNSYKYIDKYYSFRYVVIAIQIILTFIMMMYYSLVSVTYIICYSLLQIELYNHLVSLLTKNDDFIKQDNLLNKINDMIEINSHIDY